MAENKIPLVAIREFKEFIQTKTFWIGILSFPLIFAVAIVVPRWLEKAKDTRTYAVFDRSGFLETAVETRAAVPDLEVLLFAIRDGEIDLEQMAADGGSASPQLEQAMAQFKDLDDEKLRAVASQMTALMVPGGAPPQLEEFLPNFQEEMLKGFQQLADWYRELNPKAAKKLDSSISKGRYEKIDISDLGEDPIEALNEKVRNGELFAYFEIGADPVNSITSEGCRYVSENLTDDSLRSWFERYASAEVRTQRIRDVGIDEQKAAFIQRGVKFEEFEISSSKAATAEVEKVETEDKARAFAPVVFVYMLWIAVFTIAQMLLTNTVEEKSNRIIEVLLSSVSPFQLMAGKILGIAATGLTVIGSWAFFAFIGIKWVVPKLAPNMSLDLSFIVSDPVFLTSFVVYFLLGYLLYAAVLVGIGSICNSLKEAQSLLQPVTLLLIVPLLAMIPISRDPNGTLATAMSYIPPFTPFVMMNRAAGPPPMLDYVLTTLLLVGFIAFSFWAAAKVFRIGILMTGKPPKILEILRWIKAPIGVVPPRVDD